MLQEDTESFQIRSRIAQEREEGIRRIQSQVSEVNQIFRDLATIVQEQGQQMETIESHAEASSSSTRDTTSELKKAASRQKSSRERLCWLLAGVVVLLCLIVLPHMHAMQLRHEEQQLQGSAASGTAEGLGMPSRTWPALSSTVGLDSEQGQRAKSTPGLLACLAATR
ncbi:unnamed protein product [Prorocentrum cordatum]|uniref:t-SNARE coiled-coil homology domain-containing protein n=1 Tax=Prorocentrum cordatum TaxID=2364126 RepID=A0ABN9Q833_9DINO|nr:unnamed protein product [Polarella glacialis]